MPRKYTGSKLVHKTRRSSQTRKIEKSEHLYLRYKDPRTGKIVYVSTGTADTDEAEEFRQEKLSELRRRNINAPALPTNISIAEVLGDYANYMMGEPSSARLSYSMSHLLNHWEDSNVDAVHRESVRSYCANAKRANGTLRRELTDLRSAINHAVSMNRLSPFSFPEIPVKGRKRERYMTRDEVAKLLKAGRNDYRARFTLRLFIVIAYYSGARKQAIMDLKLEQINFARNTLDFRDRDLDTGNKRRSIIPMPAKLRDALMRRFQKYGEEGESIFHQKRAPKQRVKHIDKSFRSAVKRAGLGNVTPHTLRHTRVSELAQSGEEPINVAAYMAMSLQTIFEVYAHVNNRHVSEMASRIGRSPKVRTTDSKGRKITEKSDKEDEATE